MSTIDAAQSPAAFPPRTSAEPVSRPDAGAIAIVDPDEEARSAAINLCESEGYKVLAFGSADDFLHAGPLRHVTCIVLDISTPDRAGIEVLRRLAERGSAPPVIVLTGRADIGLVIEAMKLRAIDLIEKPYRPETLLEALGQARISATEAGSAWQTRREASELVDRLTKRQQEVLHGIARGEPNKVIAWKLGLSVRTVESYRAQVMARLRARNSADVVRIAIAAGIVGCALYMLKDH